MDLVTWLRTLRSLDVITRLMWSRGLEVDHSFNAGNRVDEAAIRLATGKFGTSESGRWVTGGEMDVEAWLDEHRCK